jgi:hypothetical protein
MNQDKVPCRMYSNSRESHMTGLQREVGMLALNGLHPSQLIQNDGAFALPGSLWSTGIHFTPLDNLFVSVFIGNCC